MTSTNKTNLRKLNPEFKNKESESPEYQSNENVSIEVWHGDKSVEKVYMAVIYTPKDSPPSLLSLCENSDWIKLEGTVTPVELGVFTTSGILDFCFTTCTTFDEPEYGVMLASRNITIV